jgi:hypothetical protein
MTTRPHALVDGLTKRELFAAMAMQGLCSAHDREGNWTGNIAFDCAVEAVALADELVKCLEEMRNDSE